MDDEERSAREQEATEYLGELADAGVVAVALTFVDNSGITRVKSVPVAKLPSAAAWGVGMSSVFDAFRLDDLIVSGTYAGSPVGDLRLHPDLSRLTVLAGQPGWAWAPVDRYDQEGAAHPQCSRLLATRLVEELGDRGLTARMALRSNGQSAWVTGTTSSLAARGLPTAWRGSANSPTMPWTCWRPWPGRECRWTSSIPNTPPASWRSRLLRRAPWMRRTRSYWFARPSGPSRCDMGCGPRSPPRCRPTGWATARTYTCPCGRARRT